MRQGLIRGILHPLFILLVFTVVTGLLYPFSVMAVAHIFFPRQAEGSLAERGGRPVASELIGQPFTEPTKFWGRPSATSPYPCNATASGGSNLAQTNPDFEKAVGERIAALRESDRDNPEPIPADLVTASGSGLDPHISPQAAEWQVPRVARERGLPEEDVRRLVREQTEGRTWGFIGEPHVNVLRINMMLDTLKRGD
jgi:potassium-transporting ATPase KdpC subunit